MTVEVEMPDGAVIEFPDGVKQDAIERATQSYVASPAFAKSIDTVRGAPIDVRSAVGSAPEQDRLANIKRFYPDAIPYGKDNFLFIDPHTKRPTLYNPPGLDTGDLASVAREGVQAVGATLGATAGAIGGGIAGIAGGPAAPVTVPAGATMGGAIGAGTGSAVAGSLFDIAANTIGGRIDTRSAGERVTDTALDFAGGAVGQRLGELMTIGVRALAGAGRRGASQLAEDFRSLGVTPPAGATSGSRLVQTTESMLEGAPSSSSTMQTARERVLSQVESAADDLTNRFGLPQTPQGAGETLQGGAVRAAERFRVRQAQLYDEAFAGVGADTPVPVQAVTAARERLEAELARAPASLEGTLRPAIETLQGIEADAANGGVPFGALRQIRTNIGRDLNGRPIAGSTSSQDDAMRVVYGAVTDDMSGAARSAGPDVAHLLERADRYTRFTMNQTMPTLDKIRDAGTAEQAFKIAMSAARDGGTQLNRLRRSLTAEEWDTVAASVLDRLGRATAGAQDATGEAFSANTFLTRWNNLAPEAKEALFGGSRYAELAPQLERLTRVIGALKDAGQVTNTSNTARHVMAFETLRALGGVLGLGGAVGLAAGGDVKSAAMGVAGAIVAPYAAAKLVTNPRFVQWLVDSAAQAMKPNGLAAHIGRLATIAEAEPDIREEISQYVSALRAAPQSGGVK